MTTTNPFEQQDYRKPRPFDPFAHVPTVAVDPRSTDSSFRKSMETCRNRLIFAACMLTLAFMAIAVRLVEVTALRTPEEPRVAVASSGSEPKNFGRANIVDRNGTVMATSLKTVSLSANPQKIENPIELAAILAPILTDVPHETLLNRLGSDRRFVWLERKLTPRQQYEVNRLGIPALTFHEGYTRVYPQGALAAHVLGFANVDNQGISGVEKKQNDRLTTDPIAMELAIDARIQHVMREELQAAIDEFSAIGGTGIVMDVNTGEMISMVSLPDFDPNHPEKAPDETRFNRATLGVYELGSTFKIFNTAAALETGVSTMTSSYDATEPLRISRFRVRDYHAKNRWLNVPEIFIYSSNIGSARMALEMGADQQKAFMDHLGMLKRLPLEIPEVGTPQYPQRWRRVNTVTISYGHGMAVTPVHLASAVATMINGGIRYEPTLLKKPDNLIGTRVISAETSEQMRKLMRLNNVEGSGRKSQVEGYFVGGKTGTAEKPGSHGRYNRKSLISSYVAAFPMYAPRYVVYAVLDEPKGTKRTHGYATGGWVAAPVTQKVISRIGPMLGIQPVLQGAPEIEQELAIELPQEQKKLASYQN